jgi:hypothetical protein
VSFTNHKFIPGWWFNAALSVERARMTPSGVGDVLKRDHAYGEMAPLTPLLSMGPGAAVTASPGMSRTPTDT